MTIAQRLELILRNTSHSFLSRLAAFQIIHSMALMRSSYLSLAFQPLRPKAPDAYNESKAAEVAAFFVLREGGRADILKLAKLLYLAERASYEKYGAPLTGDRLSSMKDGPVLSETLNYVRGKGRPPKVWAALFNDREDGNKIALKDDVREDALLALSNADIALLSGVWERFGHMSTHDIWVYVHNELPEYEDPGKSSKPIKMDLLLKSLGYAENQIAEILARVEEENQFHAALKKAAL